MSAPGLTLYVPALPLPCACPAKRLIFDQIWHLNIVDQCAAQATQCTQGHKEKGKNVRQARSQQRTAACLSFPAPTGQLALWRMPHAPQRHPPPGQSQRPLHGQCKSCHHRRTVLRQANKHGTAMLCVGACEPSACVLLWQRLSSAAQA